MSAARHMAGCVQLRGGVCSVICRRGHLRTAAVTPFNPSRPEQHIENAMLAMAGRLGSCRGCCHHQRESGCTAAAAAARGANAPHRSTPTHLLLLRLLLRLLDDPEDRDDELRDREEPDDRLPLGDLDLAMLVLACLSPPTRHTNTHTDISHHRRCFHQRQLTPTHPPHTSVHRFDSAGAWRRCHFC
jgi:hypothetical protein